MSEEEKESSCKIRRFLQRKFLEATEKEKNVTKTQILTLNKWKRGIIWYEKYNVDRVLRLK